FTRVLCAAWHSPALIPQLLTLLLVERIGSWSLIRPVFIQSYPAHVAIGTKRTSPSTQPMSAFGGKADISVQAPRRTSRHQNPAIATGARRGATAHTCTRTKLWPYGRALETADGFQRRESCRSQPCRILSCGSRSPWPGHGRTRSIDRAQGIAKQHC